jgi:hypothetical protein
MHRRAACAKFASPTTGRLSVATASKRSKRFSDDELVRVSALIKDSDRVELKLTVPEVDHRSAVGSRKRNHMGERRDSPFNADREGAT